MAKRFTDTDKWKDEWFTDLDPMMKIFWVYLCDNCDHAGVWKVNFKLASNTIGGCILDKQSALKAFGGRVRVIKEDKWFIEKFIPFQYPKGLSETCKAHVGVINILKLNNIEVNPYLTLINGFGNSKHTVQDKDKDKDKDKDSSSSFLNTKSALNIDAVIQLFNDELASKKVGKITFCHGLSSNQFQDFLTTISFRQFQTMEAWKEIFEKVKASEFLSGSGGSFVATLNWLVKHDNALKVLNGQYGGESETDVTSIFAQMKSPESA